MYFIASIKMTTRARRANRGQLSLDLRPRTWGGARKGAGRRRTGRCLDAPHRKRPAISRHHPIHVVLRTRKDVPRLRRGPTYRAIDRALRRTLGEHAFRVVHTSIQHNHLHFLVEADDKSALSRGMRSLTICAARAINRVLGRKGAVFAYRYNAKPITNPRQMRNALAYVLNNWRRHHEDLRSAAARQAHIDPYSTAIAFAGWKETSRFAVPAGYTPLPSAEPRTWLMRVGWLRHGPISVYEEPGALV
jgi:REP element-mobilizing transposase RayT